MVGGMIIDIRKSIARDTGRRERREDIFLHPIQLLHRPPHPALRQARLHLLRLHRRHVVAARVKPEKTKLFGILALSY